MILTITNGQPPSPISLYLLFSCHNAVEDLMNHMAQCTNADSDTVTTAPYPKNLGNNQSKEFGQF